MATGQLGAAAWSVAGALKSIGGMSVGGISVGGISPGGKSSGAIGTPVALLNGAPQFIAP